jgi:hypothetical protein
MSKIIIDELNAIRDGLDDADDYHVVRLCERAAVHISNQDHRIQGLEQALKGATEACVKLNEKLKKYEQATTD